MLRQDCRQGNPRKDDFTWRAAHLLHGQRYPLPIIPRERIEGVIKQSPCTFCGTPLVESTVNEMLVPESIKAQREKLQPAKCCIGYDTLEPTDPAMLLKCCGRNCLASLEFFRDAKATPGSFEIGCNVHGKMARISIFPQFNPIEEIRYPCGHYTETGKAIRLVMSGSNTDTVIPHRAIVRR